MPGTDQIDYAALADQARQTAPPPPTMTYAIVNNQRVPIGDDTPDTAPATTPPPAAPIDYTKLAEQARQAAPAPKPPEPSLWEKANTSPLHPYFEAARKAVTQAITQAPGLDLAEAKANDWTGPLKLGTVSAMGRGAIAGGLEGVSKIAESFTTPTGFALWLTGLGAESAAVKAIPALKPLIALPAIQNLRAAVHGTAGAAFAAHGVGTAAGGLGTLWDAATSAQAPPEGRWGKALSGLGEIGQGTIEAATGILGVHGALEAPAVQNWQQARRTAAGAAAMNDFRLAAPPSVAAPYTTEQLQRAYPLLLREHATGAPITTVDEGIAAADSQLARLERGFDQLIAVDPHQLITTKPLDAVQAALGNAPRDNKLALGLKNLDSLHLERPLTVYDANQARIQLNAENAVALDQNKYDVAKARKVDPAFAAREAAVASLRQGIHDVLDPRAQQAPGFTRDLRLDEGALLVVRNALYQKKFQNATIVGGSGVTSGPRRIGARALEYGLTGTGAAAGGAIGAAGGPSGAAAGAVAGSILGKELGGAAASTVNKPPITRDALIERSFGRAGALAQPTPPPAAPGGPAFPPTAPPAGPGLPPPGGGPGGPGGPGAGPGLPPAAGPTAGLSPREIGVGTFLMFRARGLSREQAVQAAASYVRSLPSAPEPRALPPMPPRLLGAGPRFVTDAAGQTVPLGQVAPGALIPDNGARVPTMPEGGYRRPPGRDRSSVRAVPGTYAERVAGITAPLEAEAATIAPDAAPAVAPEPAPAARAGRVAPGGGPQLPAAAGERVLAPAERTARARERAAGRAADRAAAAAEESQGLADLVTQAQAAGYSGDPAALRAELADRLQGIKELHAELDQSGTNGMVLLRAIADAGGLSEAAAEHDGAGGELRRLKEVRDTAPSERKNAGPLAPRRVLDTVRGVRGVFREQTQRQQGGFVGGQSLDSMVAKLQQDPRFYFIQNADDLSEAIHTAATGRDETRNALKDLAANSHDLIGTATHYPEDDLSFDPAALEAESQAHAAATPDRPNVARGGFGAGRPAAAPVSDVADVTDTPALKVGDAVEWTIGAARPSDPPRRRVGTVTKVLTNGDVLATLDKEGGAPKFVRADIQTRRAGVDVTPPSANISDPAAPLPADGPQKGEIVTFQMPDASAKGSHKQAGTVIGVLPDGRLDIRLQQGGFVQKAPGDLARPNAPPAPEAAAPVSDVLDTGELQGRLPGAGAARQVGKADVSLRAPVQASGNDFTLETPLTDEQRAADAAKAQGPSLFDAPAEESAAPAPSTVAGLRAGAERARMAAAGIADRVSAAYVAQNPTTTGYEAGLVSAQGARLGNLAERLTRIGGWVEPSTLGRGRIADDLAALVKLGEVQRAWNADGDTFYATADRPVPAHLTTEPEAAAAPVSDVGDVGDTPRSTGGPYVPDPTRSATERGGAVVLASSPAPTGDVENLAKLRSETQLRAVLADPNAPAHDHQAAAEELTYRGLDVAGAAPGVSELDIPLELAERAHAGTSMTPEKRGAAERAGYVEHMNSVWADLIGRATTPEQRATAAAEFARYRDGYLERTRQQLSQRSGIMSANITGPANFPTARMEKKDAAYRKGVSAFVEWDQRARRAMREAVDPTAAVSISSDRPDAPDALQAKIDAANKLQDQMKAINAIVRQQTNDTQKIAAMQAIGVSEDAARKALQPDFAGRKGFPSYALRNNAANIDRMQSRIADLATERARPLGAATFDGGTIKENADLNRIQVTFDGKPDETMRAQLKANGFKWAPSMQVWQRQRTQNARDAIQRIFKVKLEPPPE